MPHSRGFGGPHFGTAETYAVQCKHASRHDATLRMADLSGELAEVSRLAQAYMWRHYDIAAAVVMALVSFLAIHPYTQVAKAVPGDEHV